MSFRNRLILAAALAVAIAVALSSVVVYFAVRRQLLDQVDNGLRQRVAEVREDGHVDPPALGGAGGYVQIVTERGQVIQDISQPVMVPASDGARLVAAGSMGTFFSDLTVQGVKVRVLTAPYTTGLALQVVRPLDEMELTLKRLSLVLIFIATIGIALAAVLGRMVAQAALVPVRRLTAGAERVAETGSTAHRIDAATNPNDEIGRLATSFNSMLQALEDSEEAQRHLVTDASHELRTPLTSLRTNIEVLARATSLPDAERKAMLEDLKVQIQELTVLVGDLTDLARGDDPDVHEEELRLDQLVEWVVRRIRTHYPEVEFVTDLQPALVHGVPSRLDRAVANLLDNAGKWSPEPGKVEVGVRSGEVTVRDHGPGIDETDLPHIFDRFYRSSEARALPGSGLGLSIVKRIVKAHGGKVTAKPAEGGGALFRISLPALPFSEPPTTRVQADRPGGTAQAEPAATQQVSTPQARRWAVGRKGLVLARKAAQGAHRLTDRFSPRS